MLSEQEWESLCNKCGKCCYLRLDNHTRSTTEACVLLDKETNKCICYEDRVTRKFGAYAGRRTCVVLQEKDLEKYYMTKFLPDDCAYIQYWRKLNG